MVGIRLDRKNACFSAKRFQRNRYKTEFRLGQSVEFFANRDHSKRNRQVEARLLAGARLIVVRLRDAR
jgi:hypothetical protein